MDDYKPNSHKYKESQTNQQAEKKKVEKVISGTARTKKKGEISKFADIFISEDAANVKSYLLTDVIVPAVKKVISDIVRDGIDMILYGSTGVRKQNSNHGQASYVSYNRFADSGNRVSTGTQTRTGYSYEMVIVDSRGEAEEIVARMDELIDLYGEVSVADLYDLAGITGHYTDNKYGWKNIHNVKITRARDGGYVIEMPKALPL